MSKMVSNVTVMEQGVSANAEYGDIERSVHRPLSPNGALSMIPPEDFTVEHKFNPKAPMCARKTDVPVPRAVRKKVSFGSPLAHEVHEVSPDMRYDDEEFTFTALLILSRMKKEGRDDPINTVLSSVESIWTVDSDESSLNTVPFDGIILTQQLLDDFDVALQHRISYFPLTPSKGENKVEKVTRAAAFAVANHGYPCPNDSIPDDRDDTKERGLLHRFWQCIDFPCNEPVEPVPSDSDMRQGTEESNPELRVLRKWYKRQGKLSNSCGVDRSFEDEIVLFREFRRPARVGHRKIDERHEAESEPSWEAPSNPSPIFRHSPVNDQSPVGGIVAGRSVGENDMDEKERQNEVDRRFEENAVVFREYKSQLIDASSLRHTGTSLVLENSSNDLRRAENVAAVLRELSVERQKIVEETQRVQRVFRSTTNENVRNACWHRLETLRGRLEELSSSRNSI